MHPHPILKKTRPVPMQPWINAQAPRLHMTPDACPDPKRPSVDACYDTRAAGKVCAAGKKSYRAGERERGRGRERAGRRDGGGGQEGGGSTAVRPQPPTR